MKVSGKIPALPGTYPANPDRPHPRPGHRTRAAWRGKPRPRPAAGTHTCCRGWGFARLCSGAGRGSRSRGSPSAPRPLAAPRLRSASSRSSAHHARGRARGPAPAAGPGPRLRPRLLFRRARPGSGAAARLSETGPSAGRAGGQREPGRGRGLGTRRAPGPNGRAGFVAWVRGRGDVSGVGAARARVESGKGRGEKGLR